ncbi:MAG: helix-turn-helix domain-containing protein [Steroidobacteraceae bacterium]
MSERVLIPLPGIGTLALTREAYEAALIPIGAPESEPTEASTDSLVNAKELSVALSLPVSCIYEYAKAGRIPSVRIGRHVRFNQSLVLSALRSPGAVTVGHG